jgi:FkbM family methyltransferase
MQWPSARPARDLWNALRFWRAFRRDHAGLFPARDAALGLHSLILPQRLRHRSDARHFREACTVSRHAEGIDRVEVRPLGVSFLWPAPAGGHLWHPIEQEALESNPHHYTTPPIRLGPESTVLDVGACEGLFAFRVLRQGLARRVTCFEPFPSMAALLREAAALNGLADRLGVEGCAVCNHSGEVGFRTDLGSDSSQVIPDPPAGFEGLRVRSVRIDDWLAARGERLRPQDLLKIDAEGADLDVLRGAERTLREDAPQVAVTTYHEDDHAHRIQAWLRSVQPNYRFRLKGFSFWTPRPRPVLLQASAREVVRGGRVP